MLTLEGTFINIGTTKPTELSWSLPDSLAPNAAEPKLVKADALIGIAENMLTATGRNYTLSYALELKEEAEASSKK